LNFFVPQERHLVPIFIWFSTSILLGFTTNYSRYLTLASSLKAQKEISAIVNNMLEGVVVCDTEVRMIFANLAAHQILGLPDGSLISLRLDDPSWQIFWENGEPMKFEQRPYALALRNKIAVKDVTMVVRAQDGKEQIVSLTAVPTFNDETKGVDRIIITYQDLTEVKAAEKVSCLMKAPTALAVL